ncbi:MAG TPA: hypothetical protein PLP29_02245 [Candidatus Ozemobacteraceae bacterium]|nr:hypothetical protein [Candidatus Ozemobacteraceae bacterium]
MARPGRQLAGGLFLLLVLFAWLAGASPSEGHTGPEYRRPEPGEPVVEAILHGPSGARAWIRHGRERFHAVAGTRIDGEWQVDDVRQESVLFRRSSSRTFVEMRIPMPSQPPFHHGWSFTGLPIGLWEALELLTAGFGYHVVMHFQSGGGVVPFAHAMTLEKMLGKVMPRHHRFALTGPVLLVLPYEAAGERWTEILERIRSRNPEELSIRFQGLKKPGTLLSRGDDIQMVLRQIALGGETPMQFPKDLHFPVYASFRQVPFHQMLAKIVYLNQCFIIDRTDHLEIMPWPRQIQPLLSPPIPDFVSVGPVEPQPGFGPTPPDSGLPSPEARQWQPLPLLPPSSPSAGQDSE